jgi:hypothetical protein
LALLVLNAAACCLHKIGALTPEDKTYCIFEGKEQNQSKNQKWKARLWVIEESGVVVYCALIVPPRPGPGLFKVKHIYLLPLGVHVRTCNS